LFLKLLYNNTQDIINAVIKFHSKLPPKTPNQCDAKRWSFDIGEASDCLNNELIDKTNLIIQSLVAENIKPTFATKLGHPANINKLIDVPKDTARVRMSVAPPYLIEQLELGSCKLEDRLAGIEVALNKGYEVHLNFSPIILYRTWKKDYEQLLELIDKTISEEAKKQLKCEVIFLTHSSTLHEESLTWNPEAEKLLWTPFNQEIKTNTRGSLLLRYNNTYRTLGMNTFRSMLNDLLPYCEIRYIF
jgi:DNA repair photolyase